MIRNICYANAKQYLRLPTSDTETMKRRQTGTRSNGEPAARRGK